MSIRIRYADFPYLHYSSARGLMRRPDADMGTDCHENNNASLGFPRTDKSLPDTTRGVVLYGGVPILVCCWIYEKVLSCVVAEAYYGLLR